jgi:hypothetical protein
MYIRHDETHEESRFAPASSRTSSHSLHFGHCTKCLLSFLAASSRRLVPWSCRGGLSCRRNLGQIDLFRGCERALERVIPLGLDTRPESDTSPRHSSRASVPPGVPHEHACSENAVFEARIIKRGYGPRKSPAKKDGGTSMSGYAGDGLPSRWTRK